jgi:hypothetical protein
MIYYLSRSSKFMDMVNKKKIKFCSKCGIKFSNFVDFIPNFCPNCGIEVFRIENNSPGVNKCLICHKPILSHQRTIECSYCSGSFHYSCSAAWFNRHNACPFCQNVFLYPRNRKI